KALGEAGEVGGGLGGDVLRRLLRLQPLRVEENGAQDVALLRLQQVVQLQRGRLLYCVREVGVNDDALHIGDDEQRRVKQRLAVLEKLLVSRVEVGVFALILPGEKALLPHVGPALIARLLRRARLEGEELPGRVHLGWRAVADQPANVDEMRLGAGTLLQLALLPEMNKMLWRH